ncbi:MAG: HDOD domain-containing protein [Comamonas sp.]|nr:HDOD domain-containing protein [Comamonas sp.]
MTTRSPSLEHSPALIARQAIVNSEKSVIGYELFNRSRAPAEHTAASDVLLVFTALSHAGAEDLVGDKLLFVNCTHESLAGGHLELLDPSKIVLEIQDLGHSASAEAHLRLPMLQTLKQRGFRLSFGHSVLESVYASWLPLADFIKLDLTVLPRQQWGVLTQYAQKNSTAHIIATKMETAEQFDLLLHMGVKLFQGFWFARPAVFEAKILAPRQASLVELIGLLRRQASTDDLEDVLKKDAGLAFNLLRLINSASFGIQREITSFRQAVLLMGLKKLFRWAALLLAATKYADTPPSLGQTAVVRGRLMELLAEEFLTEEETDMAFVTGIFSLLDVMLSIPIPNALQLIHAPELVNQALLQHTGPLADLLTLAKACENNDDSAFDEVAEKLGLTNQQINWAHLRALAWSDSVDG